MLIWKAAVATPYQIRPPLCCFGAMHHPHHAANGDGDIEPPVSAARKRVRISEDGAGVAAHNDMPAPAAALHTPTQAAVKASPIPSFVPSTSPVRWP